jgi:hypothetical protein
LERERGLGTGMAFTGVVGSKLFRDLAPRDRECASRYQ